MPQNKKTEPGLPELAADLPWLTKKQMAFVMALLNGETTIEALRQAYPSTRKWTENSANVQAWKMANNPKIIKWMDAYKLAGLQRGLCTREQHVGELRRIKEIALATGNLGAAKDCEVHVGKVNGLYVERSETTIKVDEDLADRIEHLNPELAEQVRNLDKTLH